jgi:N-acetyl sugar amidotransferase
MNICKRCILDETIKDIWFDTEGICKYCHIHDEMEKEHPLDYNGNKELENIIKKIKKDGKYKDYDCIAGVSGGRDSTYTLYKAVQMGLRPLAVHFDNGWNSDISVTNIKNACEKLNVELHTVVADWEEFKDLQIAFLKSGTPDADIPADYAIYSVLFDTAHKEGTKYILNGHSFRTEGTSPISWTYMDGRYIKSVHRKFGKIKKIKSFPVMTMYKLLYYVFVKRIKEVRLMEHINYVKKDVDSTLEKELDWKYYGGHNNENNFTKFFQSFYLPKRFGIDKRKTELSAMVRSGQIKRSEALQKVRENPYLFEKETVEYVINKLGLTQKEFDDILNAPIKSHDDYPTYLPFIRLFKYPIKIAVSLHLLPQILYLKYAK